jgi:hypothetical protein
MSGPTRNDEREELRPHASGASRLLETAERRLVRYIRHPDAMTLALGFVIGIFVCVPLFGGRRLFLLDWSIGPHLAVATPAALGLSGGLTTSIGGSAAIAILNRVLGGAATWLPILFFFPIAMVGAGKLAGRSRWSRVAAGTLYAVNPFVFNRLYVGHIPLLIGYALLPFATAGAIRSASSRFSRWLVPALWWAALTSLSPHFAWIYGVVIAGVFVVGLWAKELPVHRLLSWFATSVGAFALMSAYIILPHAVTSLPTRVGSVSLSLYRTSGDPHLGLFANVLSLYGFWRTGPGPELPKAVVLGWPYLMFAILLIVVAGAWYALRTEKGVVGEFAHANPSGQAGITLTTHDLNENSLPDDIRLSDPSQLDQRQLAILLIFVGAVGYFLALGNQGPTGGFFLWAYDHVPFFALMREPQKFLMLLVMAYAILFGWGVERLAHVAVSPQRVGAVVSALLIGVALPLGYTATIFDGLAGQIAPSPLPLAYQQANALMGDGSGNILYLPWHLYMEYPFADGRVISNVAPTSFSRNVISGDNVEVDDVETQSTSPRSAYLQRLYANAGHLSNFGALVTPLGVKFVVLAKTADWSSYAWLARQKDLELVFNDSSLEVWQNKAYGGVGERVAKLTSVSGLTGVLGLANSGELGNGAVVTRRRSTSSSIASASAPQSSTSVRAAATSREVQQLSQVAYLIAPGAPGWVEIDATYQRGWSLDGTHAIQSAEGTVLVRAGAQGGVLRFTPWGVVRLGYTVSVGAFTIFEIIVVWDSRRRAKREVTEKHL